MIARMDLRSLFHSSETTRRHFFLGPALLCALSLLGPAVQAQDYYVSRSGSDATGTGTVSAPFATVARSSNVVTAGDTVIVQAGTYNESVVARTAGTALNPITYRANGTVVLKSFSVIRSYVVVDGFEFTGQTQTNTPHIQVLNPATPVQGVVIRNNIVRDLPASAQEPVHGIIVDGTDCVVSGNTVRDIRGRGLAIRGTNMIVTQNTFSALGGYDAISVAGTGHQITHNTIQDSPKPPGLTYEAKAFETGGLFGAVSHNITVSNNLVNNFEGNVGILRQDGNANVHDWTFSNNVFMNVTGALHIYIPNVTVEHNTFYHVGTADTAALKLYEVILNSVVNETADGGIVRRNAFASCGAQGDLYGGWYSVADGVTLATQNENFVSGYAVDGYSEKRGFAESSGVNGGDPTFADTTNPAGSDAQLFNTDDGFVPLDSSPLCQTAGRSYLGAYACACTSTVPVSSFTVVYNPGAGALDATFEATDKSISCGRTITAYEWDFGDSTTGAGSSVVHTYGSANTYNATLTVRNDLNQTGASQISVTVPLNAPTNQNPTVDAKIRIINGQVLADAATLILPEQADLIAIVQDDGWPQPPGAVSVAWNQSSGPVTASFSAALSTHTFATFTTTGTYVFKVTADDGGGTPAEDTVTIVVEINKAQLTVTNGTANGFADGFYAIGEPITLTADTISGSTFDHWDGFTTNEITSLSLNTASPTLSFAMPPRNMNLAAVYQGQPPPFPNQGPTVFAGDDADVTATPDGLGGWRVTLELRGRAFDQDGLPNGVLNSTWSVVSQPSGSTVQFLDQNAPNTQAAVDVLGTYIFRLTADDGDTALTPASDTVAITVNKPVDPSLPSADGFGTFPTVLRPGTNGTITIQYTLTQANQVRIYLVDRTGAQIIELKNAYESGPTGSCDWSGENDSGSAVASGVYTLVLKVGDTVYKKRVAVIK